MAKLKGKFLENNAVTTNKIADDAVTTIKIADGAVTNSKVASGIDASKIADGSVSNTEFQYLDGVTSSIQTQLNNKANASHTHTSADITDFTSAARSAAVADAINDAVTNIAPSQNAVYDALALKADAADLADYIKKDGSVPFEADQSMGNNRLTNLAAPVSANDAVRKSYVDSLIAGLSWKQAVRAATTGPVDLSTDLENGDVLDGVTLVTNDRILVKNQTDPKQNGIYVVQSSGSPVRASDMDDDIEVPGAAVFVMEGTTNADTQWIVSSNAPLIIGTDDINWSQFGASVSYTNGNGLDLSGNIFSVKHDGEGLQFVGTDLALELDGTTLSKSSSGLKVADAGINTSQLADDSVTTSKIANNAVKGNKIDYHTEVITLTASDETNEYVDLTYKLHPASISLVTGGVEQLSSIDYAIDNTGSVTRIKWDATSVPLSDLTGLLVQNDVLLIKGVKL